MSAEWALANLATLVGELGDRFPGCLPELTTEMAFGLQMASQVLNLDMIAKAEVNRTAANEAMADVFDQVRIAPVAGERAVGQIVPYPLVDAAQQRGAVG